MKKKYFKPALTSIEIDTNALLAGSLGYGGEGNGTPASAKENTFVIDEFIEE